MAKPKNGDELAVKKTALAVKKTAARAALKCLMQRICPFCGGTGIVPRFWTYGAVSAERCEACGGTGQKKRMPPRSKEATA